MAQQNLTSRGYAVRASLNQKPWDIVLNPNLASGTIPEITFANMLCMLPFVVIGAIVGSSKWFLKSGILMMCLMAFTWIFMMCYFFGPSNSGILGISRLMSAVMFVINGNRTLHTRINDTADQFTRLTGIVSIDRNGMLKWIDGTQGYLYEIVGNASSLMFDDFTEQVLTSVRSFWRQDLQDIYFTTFSHLSNQRVTEQLQAKDEQIAKIPKELTTLRKMQLTKQLVMRDQAKRGFKVIRQHMAIRAHDESRINQIENIFHASMQSGLFIREYRRLGRKETIKYLAELYQAVKP